MGLIDRSYSEKRDFMRMQIDTPVAVSLRSENRDLNGICLNLSATGMSITIDQVLPVGTALEVAIKSPQSESIMLRANAEVIRVEGGPDSDCTLGLMITEMLE